MRHWIVVALAACGGKQSTSSGAPGPSCAQVGAHAAPMFHADETDKIAASLARHCDVDQWTVAARSCVMSAPNHDGLAQCAYKHLTQEQSDKVGASIMPLTKPPETATTSEPPATSGAQVEIAARSAEDGQALFAQGKYAEASSKYMDAVARVPEPRYFYLLCQSKYREGKFSEALTSCDAAERSSPNAALSVKIRELRSMITTEAKQQGIELD
jgi:hypothetical protein